MSWNEYFCEKPIKLNQYFFYERQWFINFLQHDCYESYFLSFCLLLWKHIIILEILPKAKSEFHLQLTKFLSSLTWPQFKKMHQKPACYGALFRMFSVAFRKPPVIVKSNTVNSANCSVSRRWWWKIQKCLKLVTVLLFKITGGFLNAATSILKRVSVRIFKISKCFHRSKQKF